MGDNLDDPGGADQPRRALYKRARPLEELVVESQEKAGYRAGAPVRLTGLQGAAHLNGCHGRLVHPVTESGRWQVVLEDGPDAGQPKNLKPDNLELLDPPARPVPGEPLQVGDCVQLCGLETRPELNGLTGTLVEQLPTRWKVRLDGSQGEKLMKARNLRKIGVAGVSGPPGRPSRRPQYWIAGSWEHWTPAEMDWDIERHCYTFNVKLASRGFESFLLLVDGDWRQCLHPDRAHACPHVDYTLCGPDSTGQQTKSWTIGQHPNDHGGEGACYEVQLVLTDDHSAAKVDWTQLVLPQGAGAPSSSAPSREPATKANPASALKPRPTRTQPSLQEVLKLAFDEIKTKGGQFFDAGPVWECVGGGDKGGILVREGEELSSAQAKDRLATGALVKQRELKGERLQYELLQGKGPATGWVSLRFKERDGRLRDLMVPTDKLPKPALKDKDLSMLENKLAKAKVKTFTDLITVLNSKDGLNSKLKAAGQPALLLSALERLKHHAEAADKAAAGLPTPQLPVQQFEVVHDIAMIRQEPAINAIPLGRKLRGEKVTAVEETFDGFVRLEGEQGFIIKDMRGKLGVGRILSPLGTPPFLAVPEAAEQPGPRKFEVSHKIVAVRDTPATNGKILGSRNLGDMVEADMQTYHGWVRLSEELGWMLTSHPELGQLLKPIVSAPRPPGNPVWEEDGDIDDLGQWAQAEVARRKGRAPPQPPVDPMDDARKRQEAEMQQQRREQDQAEQRAKQEAAQAAQRQREEAAHAAQRQREEAAQGERRQREEAAQRQRDEELRKEAILEQKRKEKEEIIRRERELEEKTKREDAERRKAFEEKQRAEAEARRKKMEAQVAEKEGAQKMQEEAEARRKRTEDARREAKAQEIKERAEREARQARELEEREAHEKEEAQRRQREAEEQEQKQEAAEKGKTDTELVGQQQQQMAKVAEAAPGQEHAELLERFREAVLSGDNALIKSTRDAAKKGGVSTKEIGRTYAAAQEQRAAGG